MKKRTVFLLTITIILLIVIIGFGGWYFLDRLKESDERISELESKTSNNTSNSENRDINNSSQSSSNKKDVEIENSDMTEEEMYKGVIEQYKNAMEGYDENDIFGEAEIEEKYNLVSIVLIEHVNRYQDNGIELAYIFYDIDKNGVKELIVGVGDKSNNNFYEGAIYSFNQKNKEPEKVYYQSTMERRNLYVYDNGIIFSEGAGRATLHYYSFGKIATDGSSFELIEEIEEEYVMDSDIPVYRDYTTNKVLNYKSFDEIWNKYMNNSNKVEFDTYYEI